MCPAEQIEKKIKACKWHFSILSHKMICVENSILFLLIGFCLKPRQAGMILGLIAITHIIIIIIIISTAISAM
jgi:hypothetical protein